MKLSIDAVAQLNLSLGPVLGHPTRCRISASILNETNEHNRRRKHRRFQVQRSSLSQAFAGSKHPSQVEILDGAIDLSKILKIEYVYSRRAIATTDKAPAMEHEFAWFERLIKLPIECNAGIPRDCDPRLLRRIAPRPHSDRLQ